jgi:hypothetical protein
MTGEEMERAIQFLIEQNQRTDAQSQKTDEQIRKTDEQVKQAEAQVQRTSADIQLLTGMVIELKERVSRSEEQAETDRREMREAINNLIVANEVTRNLTETVAQLAITTSRRVTALEDKLQ